MNVNGNFLVANQRIFDHFRWGHKLNCIMFIETIIYTNNYSLNYYNYAENCYMIACNKRLDLLGQLFYEFVFSSPSFCINVVHLHNCTISAILGS